MENSSLELAQSEMWAVADRLQNTCPSAMLLLSRSWLCSLAGLNTEDGFIPTIPILNCEDECLKFKLISKLAGLTVKPQVPVLSAL
jgi:hypothetical protein